MAQLQTTNSLINLRMSPLMYRLELYIMFLISKNPQPHFDTTDYVTFNSSNTHSGSSYKMTVRSMSTNQQRHSYFNRIPRLWNSPPSINPQSPSSSIKHSIITHFQSHFISNFDSNNPCTYQYLCPCNSCFLTPSSTSF